MKEKFLFNDLVIAEDVCNMNCEYCLTNTNEFEKESVKNKKDLNNYSYGKGSTLKMKIDNLQDKILEKFDVAILKVSGGELFMVKGIHDFILKQAKKYKCVQVLTNGVLLTEEILKQYKKCGNICIQISLDHHTVEGNYYRTKNENLLNRILNNIDTAYKIGVPIEINCVLTDKNTGILNTFLNYMLKFEKGVVVYPFPIRGSESHKYYPKEEQLQEIEKIIDNYEKYKRILAPKVYMEYLLRFIKTEKREIKCYLPLMSLGTFDDGTVTPCSNYWFISLGNILKNADETAEKIKNDKIYNLLLNDKNPFWQCKACFTPWEVLNLYLNDLMSLDELKKTPIYSLPQIEEYIISLKTELIDKY